MILFHFDYNKLVEEIKKKSFYVDHELNKKGYVQVTYLEPKQAIDLQSLLEILERSGENGKM